MPLIRVREKNQVTFPREVMEAFHMQSPGHLQYTILQDGVLIRPVSTPQENKLAKIRRLSQSVRSTYGSSAKVDEFISEQRDDWVR
jgi:bifunctional DNA-binding transcriptional regulator/antitoxin component of YhaV-PrlF toxin-antitoxin module